MSLFSFHKYLAALLLAVLLFPGNASAHQANHYEYSDHNHPLTRKGGSYSSYNSHSNKFHERRYQRKLRRRYLRERRRLQSLRPLYSLEHFRRQRYAGHGHHQARLKPAAKFSKPLVVKSGQSVRRLGKKAISRSKDLQSWHYNDRVNNPYKTHSTVEHSRF